MTARLRRLMMALTALPAFMLPGLAQEGQPATKSTPEPAEVTRIIEGADQAYRALKSLRLDANVNGEYQAAGRTSRHELKYTAAMLGDGRFKHEVPDELIVAADREATYVYFPRSLRYYRTAHEGSTSQPATRPSTSGPALKLLLDHNPSLALALADDPAMVLRSWGPIEPGKAALTLLQKRADGSVWTFRFDEKSGLLAEVQVDESGLLTAAGVPGVTLAARRIIYRVSLADGDIPDEAVAFAPPELAQEVVPVQPEAQR